MSYAIMSNHSFSVNGSLSKGKKLSHSARIRQEFCNSHDIAVFTKKDGGFDIKITKKAIPDNLQNNQ